MADQAAGGEIERATEKASVPDGISTEAVKTEIGTSSNMLYSLLARLRMLYLPIARWGT